MFRLKCFVLAIFTTSSSWSTSAMNKECHLVEVSASSFSRTMRWNSHCSPSKANKYVFEILPLKSALLTKVFRKHNLQGGGLTVTGLIEYFVNRDKLFPLNAGPTSATTDEESEVLRIHLTSKQELDLIKVKVSYYFRNASRITRLIGEAQKGGGLE